MAAGGHSLKNFCKKSSASDLNNVQTDCWLTTTWYKFTFSQYIYRQLCWEWGNIHCIRANARNSRLHISSWSYHSSSSIYVDLIAPVTNIICYFTISTLNKYFLSYHIGRPPMRGHQFNDVLFPDRGRPPMRDLMMCYFLTEGVPRWEVTGSFRGWPWVGVRDAAISWHAWPVPHRTRYAH